MKAFWKTYVVLAVLAALVAYALLVEKKHVPSVAGEPPAKKHEKVFADLKRDKVKGLTIAPASGDAVQLVKESGAWRMTAPQAVAAASSEVDSLLSSLESLEIEAKVPEPAAELGTYGLAAPTLTVGALVEGASEPVKLALGDEVPGQTQRFAKLATSASVFTVSSNVKATFEKKPFDLRDRDLLHARRDAVKAVEVTGPEGSYAVAKGERDVWTFTQPVATAADRWGVDRLLGSIESLRMESVAAEAAKDVKPFGLVKPTRVVSLLLKDGSRKTIEIGSAAPDDKFYARVAGSPLVAVVAKTLVEDLKKGMSSLRAKRLAELSVYDVDSFDTEASGAKKSYARTSTKEKDGMEVYKWKRTAPSAQDLDTNRVQDALFKIGGVEAAEFIDKPQPLAGYGLDQPALRITLRLAKSNAGPASSTWLELGQKSGISYARRPNDASVLRIDAAKADELLKAFAGLDSPTSAGKP
jgi:hypothetical protein